ncbi:MAG: flagellar basal body P-ring protein FlgI [Sedimentisphaerales bacterium]|nr:flagellar basal body P-ring protein FlgI [Sedimentisphaerales bacterium]
MNTVQKNVAVVVMLLIVCAISGCNLGGKDNTIADDVDLGPTIGSLANVLAPEPAPVEGYSIVGGLRNTGSAECPPQIRAYLKRYIQKQLASSGQPGSLDIDKYINSLETAVVLVEGIIPAIPSKNEYFDLKVTALPNTQTTSLEGGILYNTELKRPGSFGIATDVLADAEGPIFTDKISSVQADPKVGFVLGGGKVLNEYRIILALQESDFRIANAIRNRLNERFGVGTARAVLADRVEVMVPNYYKNRKQRFISMIQTMYLNQDVEATQKRIKTLVNELTDSEDKAKSEIALEAIGNQSLGYLNELLNSPDERIKLHAARCMLNLGSDAGLAALRQIAMDTSSPNRLEALEAIVVGAKRADSTSVARRLLRDKDFQVVLAAYNHLRELGDIAITQEFIGRNFYLEQIAQTELKVIYASRSGQPQIVLFGAPLECHSNIFIESENGDITLNTPPGDDRVTIMRKHPRRPGLVVHLNSSLNLGDIIKTLCEEPSGRQSQDRKGLGVTYAEVVALLKRMCDKGAIDAKFHTGELPKIDLNIKK